MSTRPNHRRGEDRRTDNGPRFEGAGQNVRNDARGRKRWKRIRARSERRTGHVAKATLGMQHLPSPLPDLVEEAESDAMESSNTS